MHGHSQKPEGIGIGVAGWGLIVIFGPLLALMQLLPWIVLICGVASWIAIFVWIFKKIFVRKKVVRFDEE